jgi:Domain of unknown function (DUF5658)
LSATEFDRRSGSERRSTTFFAYWHGARNPRRRAGRRVTDQSYAVIDWHSPRLLIPVFTILALCVFDGVLTVMLMKHGASEANPVMALFLPHNLLWFAFVKLALTGAGLCVLVACSRMRLFRKIPGELFVYAVLGIYLCLVAYELRMLELVMTHPHLT